jgi:predicted RNA methylase
MLRRALPRASVTPDDVFVDLGAGMGLVIYQAAKDYPFRRVVGVELSDSLSEVARQNIERNRHRLRCEVEIVTADVVSYEFPDDATIVYLYNPFVGEVFRGAIERVLASYDRHPRDIRLLYANPVEHEILEATRRARLVARRPPLWRPTSGWRRGETVHEYDIGPPVEETVAPPRGLVIP